MSRAAVLAYASGSFGTGVFSTVPSVLLLFYCTETLKVAPAWAGVIVFAPKAWALAWDPFVGAWSDRTRSAFGRRRPFMAAGALGLMGAFSALFATPALGPIGTAAWAGGAYFALATLYSLFAVPYIAIPAEIGGDDAGRSRLVSWRMVFAMLGVLAGAGAAPLLVEAFGGGRGGYAGMGVAVALACVLAMTPPILMLRGREGPAALPGPSDRFAKQTRMALRSAPFRALLASYLLQLTAVGVVSSATPYLVTRVFGRAAADVGIALGVMILAAIASIPLWSWLARRAGDRRALTGAVLVYAAAAAALGGATLHPVGWGGVLALFAAVGAGFGGIQLLPFIVAANLVAAEAGAAQGAMTGVWTASEKLGLAIGPAATALALGALGGAAGRGFHLFLLFGPAGFAVASMAAVAAALPAASPRSSPP